MGGILVMGGTTFVSSSLTKHLIKRGYEVDILTRGIKKVDYKGYRAHIKCDRQSQELKNALAEKDYDYVFDISAYTMNDVELLLSSLNVYSLKKYVFCSSGAVYIPCDDPIKEEFCKRGNPNWGKYGLDKKKVEDYLLSAYKNFGLPVVIFRPTYIYGENNNLYRESYFFDSIRNKNVIPVPHGNNTLTQFIHIDDLVKVFESAMLNTNVGKAYNVTHPDTISWYMLIKYCSDIVGEEAFVKNIDLSKSNIEARSFFPFRDVKYILDTSALIEDGFYIPKIDLVSGLKRTYKWYLAKSPLLHDDRMNMINDLVMGCIN